MLYVRYIAGIFHFLFTCMFRCMFASMYECTDASDTHIKSLLTYWLNYFDSVTSYDTQSKYEAGLFYQFEHHTTQYRYDQAGIWLEGDRGIFPLLLFFCFHSFLGTSSRGKPLFVFFGNLVWRLNAFSNKYNVGNDEGTVQLVWYDSMADTTHAPSQPSDLHIWPFDLRMSTHVYTWHGQPSR